MTLLIDTIIHFHYSTKFDKNQVLLQNSAEKWIEDSQDFIPPVIFDYSVANNESHLVDNLRPI